MNSRLTIVALAAASALAVSAASVDRTVSSFPGRFVPEAGASVSKMMRAPLNQQNKKGLKVFGATQYDTDKVRHFVNYYENENYLEKLTWISREDEEGISTVPNLHVINAGAYNMDDGFYYAYKVKYFTIGITYAYQWLKVNPANGEWTVIKELDNHMHDSSYLYDMAYSYKDGEMYGLINNPDPEADRALSMIGIVNLDDSSLSDLKLLDEYYYAIAFDYDGTCFGIRWNYNKKTGERTGTALDRFDMNFNVVDSREIKVDGKPYMSYWQNGLDVNHTTGDLVWAATDEDGNQKMVVINPDTYETRNLGSVGFNDVMIGLYAHYLTAEDRQAPAQVKDVKSTFDATGANSVTVSWTNPTTLWNRAAMSDLQGVRVYRDSRDSEAIADVKAVGQEGEELSFTDDKAGQGVHTYIIVPYNSKGEGVPYSHEAWIGHDVPGQVNDLAVEAIDKGKGVRVSWKAPTVGDSEGWFDSKITYTVKRLPDNKVIALDFEGLSIEDKNIPEAMTYSYQVTPKSADGEGTPRVSDGILAGASIKIPFSTGFETATDASRFTSFDAGGYPNQFTYDLNMSLAGTGAYAMKYNFQGTNDVTLVSPPLSVEKGKTYRVDFTYYLNHFNYSIAEYENHFRILAGSTPDPQGLSTVVADFPEDITVINNEKFTRYGYFTAPETGDYYVGFNVNTQAKNDDMTIYVSNFAVCDSPADDLEAVSLYTPLYVSSNADNCFDVTVYNNGSNDQSDYDVEIGICRLDGAFVPFASAQSVPAIKAHESKVVRVEGKVESQDIQDIAARVVLKNDGAPYNNTTALTEVFFEKGDPFNLHCIDPASEWTVGNLPMNLFASYSGSQTIYTPAQLGLPSNEKGNTIAGLAWEYTSQKDINDIDITVSLAATDETRFAVENASQIRTGLTEVYKGKAQASEGDGWIRVRFPDKAFNLPKGKNLLVTVAVQETACNGEFPILFKCFNSSSAGPNASDGFKHSLGYNGGSAFTDASKCYSYSEIPNLHVALLTDWSGVDEIFGGNADGEMAVTVIGNTAYLAGNANVLEAYDMSGRKVCALSVEGMSSVRLPMAAGIYILRATAADGAAKTIKAIVK